MYQVPFYGTKNIHNFKANEYKVWVIIHVGNVQGKLSETYLIRN